LSECTVVNAGVDWLTMTSPEGAATESLQNTVTQLGRESDQCGNIMASWARLGYVGWKVGPLAFGLRGNAAIVVCSGPDAETVLKKCFNPSCSVTRLDLQVTVRVVKPIQQVALQTYQQVSEALSRRQITVTSNLISGTDGGSTCYVGSRSSERFGRVYNKMVESKDPDYADCWRYEVELKGGTADATARVLVGRHDWPAWIHGAVRRFYVDRRIDACYLPYSEAVPVTAKRPRSDVDRQIRWLTEQVQPTVNTLRFLGHEDAVYKALGLAKMPNGIDTFFGRDNFGSHGGTE
jgi:DNA relaxase NicK